MLNNIDFLTKPEKEELKQRLKTEQEKLGSLKMKIKEHKLPVLVLFEGWGSSGKGTLIGEVIHNIDPRFFKVATLKLPTEEEKRYNFLFKRGLLPHIDINKIKKERPQIIYLLDYFRNKSGLWIFS